MTRLLPRLLSADDLPPVELDAARIDGQLFAVDDWFAPIDEADDIRLRAAALSHLVPDRMIAERSSALWVYGARGRAPYRHQLCIDSSNRTAHNLSSRFEYRECKLEPVDIVQFGSLRVTSHLRTAIDLLRTCEPFGAADADDVLAVLKLGGSEVSDCLQRIRAQPRYPGIRRRSPVQRGSSVARSVRRADTVWRLAVGRSARTDAIDVVDGVDPSYRVQHAVEVCRIAHFEDETAECESVARGGHGGGEDVHVMFRQYTCHI